MITKKMWEDNKTIIIALALTIGFVFFFQSRKDEVQRRQVPELPPAPAINLQQLEKEGAVPLGEQPQ